MDDFSKLEPTKHMLEWLADDPFIAIRSEVERILQQQVTGSQLKMFRVESEPQWLTGARPIEMSLSLEIARQELSLAPRMIPFGDRTFLKCIPEMGGLGNPVFSINQTDALHAGRNFVDFLNWFTRPRSEFADDSDPTHVYGDDYRRVPFWTDLVRYNVSV